MGLFDSFKDHRSENLELVAQRLGLDFNGKDAMGYVGSLSEFQLGKTGASPSIEHFMSHQDTMMEQFVAVFDYSYLISTGKSTTRITQTVFSVKSPKLNLPEFWMKPENFFHRVGSYLGFDDINFEEYPEFSKSNYLKSTDVERLSELVVTEPFARMFSVNKEWKVEGINYYLILYKENAKLEPHEIENFYRKGMELFKILTESSNV